MNNYLPTLPYTQQPVADLWDICLWANESFKSFFAKTLGRDGSRGADLISRFSERGYRLSPAQLCPTRDQPAEIANTRSPGRTTSAGTAGIAGPHSGPNRRYRSVW